MPRCECALGYRGDVTGLQVECRAAINLNRRRALKHEDQFPVQESAVHGLMGEAGNRSPQPGLQADPAVR